MSNQELIDAYGRLLGQHIVEWAEEDDFMAVQQIGVGGQRAELKPPGKPAKPAKRGGKR